MQKSNLVIYCDGGSRGNPGPAASAFVATQKDPSKDEAGEVVYKESKFLGIETNNVAEYEAVLLAVNWLVSKYKVLSTKYIVINLDSQLIERQLNGFYKIKNIKLKILANEIKLKIENYKLKIIFHWGYRTNNTLADALVNETLDKSVLHE